MKEQKKAKNGEISIRKKANGYEARTSINIYGVGSIRLSRFSNKSENEAIKKLQESIVETYMKYDKDNLGNYAKMKNKEALSKLSTQFAKKQYDDKCKNSSKFKNVAFEWLREKQKEADPLKTRHISYKTVQGYVTIVKTYLIPQFGEFSIDTISSEQFQEYIDKRTDEQKILEILTLL